MQEKYLGRKVIEKKTFQVEGTFQSAYAAERWLNEKGYDGGSSSATQPTAFMKGNYYDYGLPHKWKNFTKQQEKSVHACLQGDFREGPLTAYIFE